MQKLAQDLRTVVEGVVSVPQRLHSSAVGTHDADRQQCCSSSSGRQAQLLKQLRVYAMAGLKLDMYLAQPT
jgi:hypothetical protein